MKKQYSPAPGCPRAPHLVLIFDGVEDMIHEDFEQSEVGFLSIDLGRILWGLFVDCAGRSILILREGSRRRELWLLPLILSFGSAIDCALGRILNLDVLLGPKENILHLGDFVLHQMFVERVGDLQPTDGSHVVIAVIHQSHLALKITDIMFAL